MATNFLAVPSKQALPLPDFSKHLLQYISGHFRDAHPDAFRRDVDSLVAMRREWVDPKTEAHPEIIKGLMKYHAQLAFVATKFPSDIGVSFAYRLPFPSPYSMTPDAIISLNSFTYERASVLYNTAAIYASLAAMERRAEAEGIKRALNYLSSSAGILNYLITSVLPTLKGEMSSPQAAGYDMSESFLTSMREFVLAQAQECFWQQAVLQGSYKNALVAKLSMKVSEYYRSSLKAANGMDFPSASNFPQNWTNHVLVKANHFEAAAQYRQSQDDLEKGRYGQEIARLRVAEGLAKKGLDAGRKGVSEAVVSDLRSLSSAVKSSLDRAVRDNDLVYIDPVPPASQLAQLAGVGMVKLNTPTEISEPVAWLMNGGSGQPPLFSQLVPYGVHLALSIYDDRKDTVVREMDGKREELDGVAASTLQSLNLPGSLQALERPVGLPPSLIKKAEEVDAAGGADKIRSLLMDVKRLSKSNAKVLEDAMDILDQEATENEQLLERQPHLAETRQPSHVANTHLIGMAGQYDATLKQAASSDGTVRAKWEEWRHMIEILSDGEDIINDHVPSTTGSYAALPSSVRPLRASLEELDDRIAHRAALVAEARAVAAHDDVRPEVLQEASRLAHGGSGDVKPEWFEPLFDKAAAKYDRLRDEMDAEAGGQDELLEQIRKQNEAFLAERKEDPRVKERERSLQDMDMAYWKWREIVDNADEGIKFYNQLANHLQQFKDACSQFLNARRVDVGQVTNQLAHVSFADQPAQQHHQSSLSPQFVPSPPPAALPVRPSGPSAPLPPRTSSATSPLTSTPQTFSPAPATSPPPVTAPFLAHPSSAQWQSSADFLPPPPPQPVIRSGGVPSRAAAPAVDSPRRMTRSQARQGPIGDPDHNPYRKEGKRRGEGVI
ncbi:hypothetical protein CcaverHIS002_0502370 [Cutaneotrichosporon cavernicola]|uniref:BRO1 domain-containing protein n=1 Tax=Cutaneotrichosporon cavernicola TaxID=279322 RepID=A0AA48L648_9TREE|nr:uncharacterized protein CcaverHIS019_0502950 [Cutaneotrichosporon cavernicola]BEI84836.1 hypothetical protein CcaverHIS002_0502370 [Cutaneotrichosporon cavernicola]BEI92667.1 hypothetical protein CcaverHIS019_0502950 [Cutaneotrichosporon cavernicola]BEJ00442.1 hypothetical protein CcaverHIS631_0502990 [Cutaneotrichosporon cavernicola]BEJ08211.1 hypothetical protein CcaverHIS641_0502960 [Cutaneotrichosporon cavernicola]